jgi:hypothetical protein
MNQGADINLALTRPLGIERPQRPEMILAESFLSL